MYCNDKFKGRGGDLLVILIRIFVPFFIFHLEIGPSIGLGLDFARFRLCGFFFVVFFFCSCGFTLASAASAVSIFGGRGFGLGRFGFGGLGGLGGVRAVGAVFKSALDAAVVLAGWVLVCEFRKL